ncbi:MAG: hypothetical protein ACREDH_11640 [Methylocella sp.]
MSQADVLAVQRTPSPTAAEAGASVRKDGDGGWPGVLERFRRGAEA